MTIEEMQARKRELGYSYKQIAEMAHLPLSTVQKVLGGQTKSPRRDTISALEYVLGWEPNLPPQRPADYRYDLLGPGEDADPSSAEFDAKLRSLIQTSGSLSANRVAESALNYRMKDDKEEDEQPSENDSDHPVKRRPGFASASPAKKEHDPADVLPAQKDPDLPDSLPRRNCYGGIVRAKGEYTYEDYLALPDNRRVELIDGIFYDMACPHQAHQEIQLAIYEQVIPCIRKHNNECRFLISPVDVRLDRNNRTVVQPDIMVICNPSIIEGRYVWGAPDFVVEVLSRSTKRKDMVLKLHKYLEAGVKEYWMIDYEKHEVIAYVFSGDLSIKTYTFDDTVPIAISKGECEIDFKKVYEQISFYYDESGKIWPPKHGPI